MTSSGTQWLQKETDKETDKQARIDKWVANVKKVWNLDPGEMSLAQAKEIFGGINSLGLEPADPNFKHRSVHEKPKIINVPARAGEQPPWAQKKAKNMNNARKKHNKLTPFALPEAGKTFLI